MKTPVLLLGTALVFWGVMTGWLYAAIPLAVLIESSRLLRRRLDLSRANFHRVSDLCALMLTASAVYAFFARDADAVFLIVAQSLPIFLFPLMAAQACSVRQGVDVSTFFWSWRARQEASGPRICVDFSYPYFAACLFSAGGANLRTPFFYAAIVALSAWALWNVKPIQSHAGLWVLVLLAASLLGYHGHIRLRSLQLRVEQAVVAFVYDMVGPRKDVFQSRTAMGSIGTLKQFDVIVLRLQTEEGRRPPGLLSNASYNSYKGTTWSAKGSAFRSVARGKGEKEWELAPGSPDAPGFRLSGRMPQGKGVLSLPQDAVRLEGLLASSVRLSRFGAVKVEDVPEFLTFKVRIGPGSSREDAPDDEDLSVSPRYRPVLSAVVAQLGLAGMRPDQAMAELSSYFQRDFRYSIYEADRGMGVDPLVDFLLRTKAGHCEYFATATVLLLREAGIPARYATGFSVQEFSELEDAFLIRQRHAHAWARAYVEGKWVDLDSTPSTWSRIEGERASLWEPVKDFFSWVRFRFSAWRWSRSEEGNEAGRFGALALVLIGIMFWRVYASLRTSRVRGVGKAAAPPRVGGDSEFFEIEKALGEQGRGRRCYEPTAAWLARIEEDRGPLKPLLELHNRYRFDPKGLDGAQRDALRSGVRAWLRSGRLTYEPAQNLR